MSDGEHHTTEQALDHEPGHDKSTDDVSDAAEGHASVYLGHAGDP